VVQAASFKSQQRRDDKATSIGGGTGQWLGGGTMARAESVTETDIAIF